MVNRLRWLLHYLHCSPQDLRKKLAIRCCCKVRKSCNFFNETFRNQKPKEEVLKCENKISKYTNQLCQMAVIAFVLRTSQVLPVCWVVALGQQVLASSSYQWLLSFLFNKIIRYSLIRKFLIGTLIDALGEPFSEPPVDDLRMFESESIRNPPQLLDWSKNPAVFSFKREHVPPKID